MMQSKLKVHNKLRNISCNSFEQSAQSIMQMFMKNTLITCYTLVTSKIAEQKRSKEKQHIKEET